MQEVSQGSRVHDESDERRISRGIAVALHHHLLPFVFHHHHHATHMSSHKSRSVRP